MVIHIVYKLKNRRIYNSEYVQLNRIFGNCNLTKTTDKKHYGYSDGIFFFFDALDKYNGPDPGKTCRNMLIYGVDMTNSIHTSNKTDNFYCIGKAQTQGLQNGKTVHDYAAHDYVKTNGSEMKKIHVLSVCYNGDNSYIILNGVEQAKSKAMTNLKLTNPLVTGNTTEDFRTTESKSTSLRGNIYNVSVDYLNLNFSKLMSVQSYLTKKYNIQSV